MRTMLALLLIATAACARSSAPAGPPAPRGEAAPGPRLLERRAGFATRLSPDVRELERDPFVEPPRGMYEAIRYESAIGPLRAYVTPDPRDGGKHAAVLDCHSGFGGVGAWLWEPPDHARPLRDAGLIVMSPSWRGENDNPGRFEMFWGEVDDALAALRHLRSLPYVDPARIYVIGHSTGGTIAMLLAAETDQIRAAFSFEGAPDVARWLRIGGGPGFVPFDAGEPRELALRSALALAPSLRVPTSWFYAPAGAFADDVAPFRAALAAADNPRVQLIAVRGADHMTIHARLAAFVAAQIAADRDIARPFPPLDPAAAQRAFDAAR